MMGIKRPFISQINKTLIQLEKAGVNSYRDSLKHRAFFAKCKYRKKK